MLHKVIKYTTLVLLLLTIAACEDYLDINTDPNAPENPGNLDLLMADMTGQTAYNLIGGGNWTRLSAQWIQHIADNSAPPSTDTYRINTSTMNNEWAFYSYAGVLINARKTIELATENEQWHHAGVAKVLMAHNYALLTDFWGEVPFTEALQRSANTKPVFDAQQTVYLGIQDMLDEGIELLGRESPVSVGAGDFFYQGDAAAWTRLAYALKARYYLRLTSAPGQDPQQLAQSALNALENAMQGPEDVGYFPFSADPGSEAPWFQWLDKFSNNIQISKFMVDLLLAEEDPRLPIMANQNDEGMYKCHQNGGETTASLGVNSNIGDYYLDAARDLAFMAYTEQLFLEAEANLWLGNTSEAQTAYEAAIRLHMETLSGNGEQQTVISEADVSSYLAAHPLEDLEDLIVQKYIAGFIDNSMEAYNDYRRTGYPATLAPALNADVDQIPTRMIYTDTEVNNNAANVPANITLTSKVWWDAN